MLTQISALVKLQDLKLKSCFFYTLGTNKVGIKYKGSVDIPNLSDENDMDDLDVSETFS